MEYFTSENLFCLQQFGLRPGHLIYRISYFEINEYNVITEMDNTNRLIYSLLCLFRKHSPYKNCENYA